MLKVFTLSATSPASASTAVGTGASFQASGLDAYSRFRVHGALLGATGGTLDVYVQRLVDIVSGSEVWEDWIHFAQLASGAAAIFYSLSPIDTQTIATVGRATTPALAAGSCAGGHPGRSARLLFVAGASTSAGALQTVKLVGYR